MCSKDIFIVFSFLDVKHFLITTHCVVKQMEEMRIPCERRGCKRQIRLFWNALFLFWRSGSRKTTTLWENNLAEGSQIWIRKLSHLLNESYQAPRISCEVLHAHSSSGDTDLLPESVPKFLLMQAWSVL